MIDQKRLKQILEYKPETGVFLWKERRVTHKAVRAWNTRCAGKEVGSIHGALSGRSYKRTSIEGRSYYLHRLAFLYMTGEWPPGEVDHADRDPANNAWSNLRCATRAQNSANKRGYRTSQSGVKGVYFVPRTGRWQSKIGVGGKSKHLGTFDSIDDAEAAYRAAAQSIYGQFARTHRRDVEVVEND